MNRYTAIYWGTGNGLLVCAICKGLVLPEPGAEVDTHWEWHVRRGDVPVEET